MSTPFPLAVRLISARADRHVTQEIGDVQYRATVPGGFASCQVALARPLSLQPDEVSLYGILQVSDTRNGAVLWEGRVEDPQRTAGSDGQVWELAAIGPSAHLRDRKFNIVYVDRRVDQGVWYKATGTTNEHPSATVSAIDDAGVPGNPALMHSFPAGLTIGTDSCDTAVYSALEEYGQKMAVFDGSWDCGVTNASWRIRFFTDGGSLVRDHAANTAGGGGSTAAIGVGSFAVGDNRPILKFQWTSGASSTGTSDAVWATFKEVVIRATTYSKAGVEATSGYSAADKEILASTVVADLLGRVLTQFDGANASIATTTFPIEQLAYHDGDADAEKILTDLGQFEPGFWYAAWERNSTGKYVFEYSAWPTTPGLEADVTDGVDMAGSAADLYNEVLVRYRESVGRVKLYSTTQTVAELTAAGLTRTAFVDIGDEIGTTAGNATQVGQQFLAEHAAPLNSGTLTVARPITDLTTGRQLAPWELPRHAPGQLIRLRGVQPRVDALNPAGRDGVSVCRVVSAGFSASTGAATLELDAYSYATAQALGLSSKKPTQRLVRALDFTRRRR